MLIKVIFTSAICISLFHITSAQNLVKNGGFEEGGMYWFNWQPPGLPMGNIFEVSSRVSTYGILTPADGRYFVEVDYESNFSQKINVTKGTGYLLKFAITRRFDCQGDRTFKVLANDKEVFSTLVNLRTFGSTFRYQQVEIVPESDQINLCFYMIGTAGAGPTLGVMLDDISLTEIKATDKPVEEMPIVQGKKYILKNVLFERSRSALLDSSKVELDKLAGLMKSHPSISIRLIGHTDNGGDEDKNLKLSEDRVKEVKKYLMSKGISGSRIECEGRGEKEPVADNNDPAKKYLNRRVEVEILKVSDSGQ
jgi:outer membrane protein OmpA-like peptidoglycan-associated protein